MMHSLRARLMAGTLAGMSVLLIVFAIVVYTVIHSTLVDQFDASLVSAARLLAASAEQEDEEIHLAVDAEDIPEFRGKGTAAYYEMWRADGHVSAKSPSLRTNDLPKLQGPIDEPVLRSFDLRPGLPVRAAGLTFQPEGGRRDERDKGNGGVRPLTVVVARDSSQMLGQLRFLRWLLLAATAGTIALSLLAGTVIVRRSLRPLHRIAAQIAAIREDNLGVRIHTPDTPAEMIPVQDRLNDLLIRLETSFKRERRFTADVAHELRTPLAGLRSTLEVTRSRPRDEQEYRSSLADCLEITKSMEALVNTLLRLARTEADPALSRRERNVLADLVMTCWRSFSDKAGRRGLTFESALSADLACASDQDALCLVVSNLLDNAVEYADEAGRIWIAGSRKGDTVEVRIANTGCHLSAEQVGQVFDYFWRADASRTDTGVHFGLGLSLVRRTVLALGGSVAVALEPGEVFAVYLVLPVC